MKRQNEVPLNEIWKNGHCAGCGACEAICPEQIIKLDFFGKEGLYRARISSDGKERCTACGLCYEVCPVISRDDNKNKIAVQANPSDLLDWLIGQYNRIYTGHAADRSLRYESSSGGVATVMLTHFLKKKAVDGALIASHILGSPIRHRISLARSVGDIISHKGTIYCQIDYSNAWKFIQENHDRLAIMGQPCHLKAADLFMAAKKLDTSKIFKIGLFCGGASNHRSLEYLCKRWKVSPGKVLTIRYRSGGWPGRKMVVTIPEPNNPAKTKEVVLFERDASLLQNYLYNFCFSGSFFPKSCLTCPDQTAECADISLGDAWLPRFTSSDTLGTNIIISRTIRAQELIQDAVTNGVIELEEGQPEDILCSQGNCLVGRKLGLWGKHIKKGSLHIPELMVCKRYIPQYIPGKRLLVERRFFRWIAFHLPTPFAFIIFVFYNLMMSVPSKFVRIMQNIIKGK